MQPRSKKITLGALVACFVIQTGLVYGDGDTAVKLEGTSLRGAELWHQHACQTCHQLHGFGGFLGPDLTNTASDLGAGFDERLAAVLASGPGQMPAFALEPAEVEALGAFLRAMDATGRGQARARRPASQGSELERAVASTLTPASDPAIARGFELFRERPCQACHRPFTEVTGGPPDLSLATQRRTRAELLAVLREGRAPGMPAPSPPLTEAEAAALLDFLGWLGEEREALVASSPAPEPAPLVWAELPWWEYEEARR